ncbi:hypothetical protein Q0590_33295 [Rhodocytophaga aerolata]|uniref:Uncharacterized protein n=1 Tax=Rhodocytophaga aerolata TaxID=455078 RepID=A0ABT8RK34_9BACT|nr:hypothetical protein [Rhodocytophaga aerolata]MDO1451197.1 hypothetical protein [Rhodocytophaga aerolata]
MSKTFFLTLFLFFYLAGCAFGQTKFEKESRLKIRQVPLQARLFVDSLGFQQKVKWYYEQNLQGNSIEAKFKVERKLYSVEFDTVGNLQDIEIGIGWQDMPAATIENICTALHAQYTSFTIHKIQVQYKGEPSALLSLLNKRQTEEPYTTNYELIVKGRIGRNVKLYEITFNQLGILTDTAEIIFRNTDNLQY